MGRKQRFLAIILGAVFYLHVGSASAQFPSLDGVTCKYETLKGVPLQWCIKNSFMQDKSRVLYYLHGANGHARSYIDSVNYAALQTQWIVNGQPQPIVISVSFGPVWTLADAPSKSVATNPKLLAFFTDELMKYLEAKIGGPKIQKRFVMGESMGGYNAAHLLVRKGNLFQKVVMGCPGVFSVSPFSDSVVVNDYIKRTRAFPEYVSSGFSVLGKDFVHQDRKIANKLWYANDPINLANLLGKSSPPILVWYNLQDGFGFFEGARYFVDIAKAVKANVRAVTNPYGHCEIDNNITSEIARFLN